MEYSVFPIFGAFIAFITSHILRDEAQKISAVNKTKYNINKMLPQEHQYYSYVSDKTDNKVQLAHHLVNVVFAAEILMCIIVFIIVMSQEIGWEWLVNV